MIFFLKKKFDYFDWILIVKLNYFGYHLLDEDKKLIIRLKLGMNNYFFFYSSCSN